MVRDRPDGDEKVRAGKPRSRAVRQLGEKIGQLAQAGDVILLSGELGAGKTCPTQGIARGLGILENALSPTCVSMREMQARQPYAISTSTGSTVLRKVWTRDWTTICMARG